MTDSFGVKRFVEVKTGQRVDEPQGAILLEMARIGGAKPSVFVLGKPYKASVRKALREKGIDVIDATGKVLN